MADESFKKQLGKEIHDSLRRRRKSQTALAAHLGLPRQELRRILDGSQIPTNTQMSDIIFFLGSSAEEAQKMQSLLHTLHMGLYHADHWSYTGMKNLRKKRGLSLPALSLRTGIPTARLEQLESGDLHKKPTPEEEKYLKAILVTTPRGDFYDAGTPYRQESLKDFSNIPLLNIADFSYYDKKMHLMELALIRSENRVYWEIPGVDLPVAVIADCSTLQLQYSGTAVLVLANSEPQVPYICELCCDSKGNYSLREKHDRQLVPIPFTCSEASIRKAIWTFPVIDMIIKPFYTTGETQ